MGRFHLFSSEEDRYDDDVSMKDRVLVTTGNTQNNEPTSYDDEGFAAKETQNYDGGYQQHQQQQQQFFQLLQQQLQQQAPPPNGTQPIFYVVANHPFSGSMQPSRPPYGLDFDDVDDPDTAKQRRGICCCFCISRRLSMVLVAILSILVYYIRTHGPPGPPPPGTSTCSEMSLLGIISGQQQLDLCQTMTGANLDDQEDDLPMETWRDFTNKHNAALINSLRAYLVDATWHILSWVIPQMVSDVQTSIQDLQQGLATPNKACSLALLRPAPSSDDLFAHLMQHFPIASSQPHGILPLVQRLENSLWDDFSTTTSSTAPTFFWVSQMTPGLAIPQLAETLLDYALPDCKRQDRPLVTLQAGGGNSKPDSRVFLSEDDQALEWMNRIRRRTQSWNRGGGGIVIFEQVDLLEPPVLRRLMEMILLSQSPEGHAKHTASKFEQSSADYVAKISQNIVFLFVSEKVGRSSMARHLRRSAGQVTEVALSSLNLDIRQDISAHVGADFHSGALGKITILPFWFLTRKDMEQAAAKMLTKIASKTFGMEENHSLALSEQALGELLSGQRVEFVQWSLPPMPNLDSAGSSAVSTAAKTFSISTHGIAPLWDQFQILESKLRMQCRGSGDIANAKSSLLLDFRKTTRQLVVVRRGNDDCDGMEHHHQCPEICAFHF